MARSSLKYPGIFHKSELCVINKIDLLPYVPFDLAAARENARKVNPSIDLVETSCTTNKGLNDWLAWVYRRQLKAVGSRCAVDQVL